MARNTNNTNFMETLKLNKLTLQDYEYRFRKLATSLFEWTGLPKSCNSRFLEQNLYDFGKASFLFDENFGFINTQAVPEAELNIYGLPVSINCFSFNYQAHRELYTGLNPEAEKESSCVLIMNNFDMIPTQETMRLFAYRLYEAERTIDVNIKGQKFPYFILTDEKQRLTFLNLYKKIDGNEPVVFGDKNLFTDGNRIETLQTLSPYLADKLMEYKLQIWNEALTFLGINNIQTEKKERLITDEASQNNELINMNLESFLKPRKEACNQINELFGLNVDVKVSSDLQNIIKTYDSIVSDRSPKQENTEGSEEVKDELLYNKN